MHSTLYTTLALLIMGIQSFGCNRIPLAEHAWTAGHRIDWDSAGILSISSGYYSRLALEAIHIRKQRKALNRGPGHLDLSYNSLLSSMDKDKEKEQSTGC